MNAGTREAILRRVRPVHRILRGQKIALFLSFVGREREEHLLDIGGGTGIDGEFLSVYGHFLSVTLVNLEPQTLHADSARKCRMVLGDGCQLPFPAHSFDWVFSNAVIEHVGDRERQRAFAEEVRRVARVGYFVTTPDKYFPIEPHTLCPFYPFFPTAVQKRVAPYTFGYLKRYEEINLLSGGELRELFPEAKIKRVGFPVWGNSLVALYRR